MIRGINIVVSVHFFVGCEGKVKEEHSAENILIINKQEK
jgi:hypothetical protein